MACVAPQPALAPYTLSGGETHACAGPQCEITDDRVAGLFHPLGSWMNPLLALERTFNQDPRLCYEPQSFSNNLPSLYDNYSLTKETECWPDCDLPDEFLSEQQRAYWYYQQVHQMKQLQQGFIQEPVPNELEHSFLQEEPVSHELFVFEGAESTVECKPCFLPRESGSTLTRYGPSIGTEVSMGGFVSRDISKSKLNPEAREWHSTTMSEGVKCSRLNPDAKEFYPKPEGGTSHTLATDLIGEESYCPDKSGTATGQRPETIRRESEYVCNLLSDITNTMKENKEETVITIPTSSSQSVVVSADTLLGGSLLKCGTSPDKESCVLVTETLCLSYGSPVESRLSNLLAAELDKFPERREESRQRSPSTSSVGSCGVYSESVGCESDDDVLFCDDSEDDEILFCDGSDNESPSLSGSRNRLMVAVLCGTEEDNEETSESEEDTDDDNEEEEESDLSDWSDDDSVEFNWDDEDEEDCCVLFDPRPSIAVQAEMVSLAERERQNSLSESDKANMRWEDFYGCVFGSSPTRQKKSLVSFSEDVCICPVDQDVDRKGPWEMYARDAQRFRDRIFSVGEKVINPVLLLKHRKKVFVDRFCDESMLEEDENVAQRVGGWEPAVVVKCIEVPSITVVECVQVPTVSVECIAIPIFGCAASETNCG